MALSVLRCARPLRQKRGRWSLAEFHAVDRDIAGNRHSAAGRVVGGAACNRAGGGFRTNRDRPRDATDRRQQPVQRTRIGKSEGMHRSGRFGAGTSGHRRTSPAAYEATNGFGWLIFRATRAKRRRRGFDGARSHRAGQTPLVAGAVRQGKFGKRRRGDFIRAERVSVSRGAKASRLPLPGARILKNFTPGRGQWSLAPDPRSLDVLPDGHVSG